MLSTRHMSLSVRHLVPITVLLPALLFVAAAYLDYQTTKARAREYVVTTTSALTEQIQEALQTANLVLARTLDRVEPMDWKAIGTSQALHEFLAQIESELPQAQSIFLVDPAGFNSASSRSFPMRPYDNRQREYYLAASTGNDHAFVTAPFASQMTGQAGFTVSRPRMTNGRFDGVVAVTLSPQYFRNFYERISLSATEATAMLVRDDGMILVRHPDVAAISRIPDMGPLLLAAADGADGSVFEGVLPVDGRFGMAAFRRVAGQPIVASFALAESYYLGQWYAHLVWMAAFALLTVAALAMTSLMVLRRASGERAHLHQLLEESERLKNAEHTVQHLQKMEALGRLSGGVAHDFNNLLAAILGALELAVKRPDDPVRMQRLLSAARLAAERGARLTAQMLAFSRHQDMSPQTLDLNDIIRETAVLIERTVDALVEVVYELDTGLWLATGDRVQFEVALLNLAGNARDAMPLGGTLTIVTCNISVGAPGPAGPPAGDYVQVSVTDTGEGMNEETQARALEPFYTTKALGKGTGLGLSQVYGFAQQLGGTVRLQSKLGAGTTVTILLPRAAGLARETDAAAVTSGPPSAPMRVLLVDDDHAVRALIEEMLIDAGHTVASAETGSLALARLSTDTAFDIMIVDFAMPAMNGAEVAAAAIRLRPDLSILFMTGYADAGILKSWTELGYRTLNKPFSADDLEAAIVQAAAPRRNGAS